MGEKFVVVAYDIPDDRRRTRLHHKLIGFGTPVQYSVFECLLDDRQLSRMKKAVRGVIRPRTDHVRYYYLCAACRRRIESTAAGGQGVTEEPAIIV